MFVITWGQTLEYPASFNMQVFLSVQLLSTIKPREG